MKRIGIFILMLLLPVTVHASNILDNYHIDINIIGKTVQITEKFDTIEVNDSNNNFIKGIHINDVDIDAVESNIDNYKIEKEGVTWLILGNVSPSETYYIKYTITDYTNYGVGVYNFYNPEYTTIRNLNLKIEYNEDIEESSLNVYGYKENIYEISRDGNLVIGTLLEPTDDARFMVNARVIEKAEEENIPLEDIPSNEFQGTKKEQKKSIGILTITIIIGIVISLLRGNTKKYGVAIYAVLILILIILQLALTSPWMILFFIFYGFFYWLFYVNVLSEQGILMEIGIAAFIILHSSVMIGISSIGVLPMLINNISIYISARLFRKYFQSK